MGETGTEGEILNAGAVNGDLINVNNLIYVESGGSGLIELGFGFDNQSGGIVETGGFLQINVASGFSNEGAMKADTTTSPSPAALSSSPLAGLNTSTRAELPTTLTSMVWDMPLRAA